MRQRPLIVGGLCLIVLAVFLFARSTVVSAPAAVRDQTSGATSHVTRPVNGWIRGGLCRGWHDYCDGPWYCQVSLRLPADCRPSEIWGALFYTRWVLWTSLALGVLFLILIVGELQGFKADEENPLSCSCGGTDFRLQYSSGEVVDIQESTSVIVWNDAHVDVWDNVHVRSGAHTIREWWAIVRTEAGDVYGIRLAGMRVAMGHTLHTFWALAGRERSRYLMHVTGHDEAHWRTPSTAAYVKVSWLPMLLFVPLQAVLFRWFAIVPIAVGLLLYAAFQSVASETRAEAFMKHLSGRAIPYAIGA